jgi:hypothetical protein
MMAEAYEELLDDLELAGPNDSVTEIIAKEVLKVARLGVHDVAEMHQRVLCALGTPQQ